MSTGSNTEDEGWVCNLIYQMACESTARRIIRFVREKRSRGLSKGWRVEKIYKETCM